jgi:hypothetical protein
MPAPSYLPGDKVWLNARNLRTNCPSRKLDNRRYGPFTVIKEVGKYAYQLDLPATMVSHPIMCDNRLGNMYDLRENMANSTGE